MKAGSIIVCCTFVVISILFVSCKKELETPTEPIPSQTWAPLELWPNVHAIDSTVLALDQSPSLINNGTYQFTFTGPVPNIISGDVIVGAQGLGYIRKVSSVSVNGNVITLQTTQGKMSDVFKNGEFNFNMSMDSMYQKTASTGFSYSINNQTIYQSGPLSIVLNSGQINLNPNWYFDFGFDPSGINYFVMKTQNGTLNGNFLATITASQSTSLFNKSDTLAHYTKRFTKWVLVGQVPVPVVIIMDLDLLVEYSANFGAAITKSGTFTSNNTFDLGCSYSNSQWTGINNFNSTNTFSLNPSTTYENISVNLALVPNVSVKLYGIAGPYASVGLQEEMKGAIGTVGPQVGVDFKTDVWLKATAGANVSILGSTLADYNKIWETSKLTYSTPYKVDIVSGNNQTGVYGQQLGAPLKIKVSDSYGNSQANIPVSFSVSSGGGSLSATNIMTDANGFAETNFTLGSSGTQNVSVSIIKADGKNIINSPISFSATAISLVPPNQISPLNNSQFNIWPRTTFFSWSNVSNAAYYTIEIRRYDFFAAQFFAEITTFVPTTTFSMDMSGMATNGSYYEWRVWCSDGNGNESAKTNWWKFEHLQ